MSEQLYRLKPLEWKQRGDVYFEEADTIFGTLRAGEIVSVYRNFCPIPIDWNPKSREHAKEIAWRWYLSQLLPALEPVAGHRDMSDLVREAAKLPDVFSEGDE